MLNALSLADQGVIIRMSLADGNRTPKSPTAEI